MISTRSNSNLRIIQRIRTTQEDVVAIDMPKSDMKSDKRISNKEYFLTNIKCFIDSFPIGGTFGYGAGGIFLKAIAPKLSVAASATILTGVSALFTIPGYIEAYHEKIDSRNKTINNIASLIESNSKLGEKIARDQIVFLADLIYLYRRNPRDQYDQKNSESTLQNAIISLIDRMRTIGIIEESTTNAAVLDSLQKIVDELPLSVISLDSLNIFLTRHTDLIQDFFNYLNTFDYEKTEASRWNKLTTYLAKSYNNYANITSIVTQAGIYINNSDALRPALIIVGAGLTASFLTQRVINHVNKGVERREDTEVHLKSQKEFLDDVAQRMALAKIALTLAIKNFEAETHAFRAQKALAQQQKLIEQAAQMVLFKPESNRKTKLVKRVDHTPVVLHEAPAVASSPI